MVVIPEQKNRVLITSALPYVNNVPHLGNIIGCVLSADVYARYQRSAGRETLFICGTDEHGTTTEAKAKEEGVTPKEICDKYYKIHDKVYKWFGISFDIFGRTSAQNHVERTHEIFNALDKNGFIKEQTIKQLYSETSKTFLADRYVEGECPYCGDLGARGDQCDACGKLLTPLELKNPRSKIDGATPVVKETTHLFLDLEKLQPELQHWAGPQGEVGAWSENAIRTTQAWFSEGLQPRAITRDLNWGVPVPKEGYEGKVFYVWFDAPIGYISITEQLLGDDWKKWWRDPENVMLYQFMAKDNIPFHTILFPGSLLGTEEEWTLLHHINSTEYLNYEDKKFSKSRGTGVFGDDAITTGLPADAFRYYLLINRPESADTTFVWEDFGEKLNNELVANFGNLVNRVVTFLHRFCDSRIAEQPLCEVSDTFWKQVEKEEQIVTDLLESVKLKEALKRIMHLSKLGNQFFQEQEPWKSIKERPEEAKEALFILANLVKDLAILVEPFLPHTAASIFKQLGLKPEALNWKELGQLSIVDQKVGERKILFEKIDDEQVKEFKARFGGQKKNDAAKAKKDSSTDDADVAFDPVKLDLRVAKITKVEKHPEAEKLYIETIDVGALGERTIVSGLVPYYKAEELEGKQIIIVANLLPAKLRGVLSEGMLLAAEDKKKNVEVLFVPESQAKPGDRLTIEGLDEAEPQSKVTIDEFFSLKYTVVAHEALVDGKRLLADGKPVKAEIEKGLIR